MRLSFISMSQLSTTPAGSRIHTSSIRKTKELYQFNYSGSNIIVTAVSVQSAAFNTPHRLSSPSAAVLVRHTPEDMTLRPSFYLALQFQVRLFIGLSSERMNEVLCSFNHNRRQDSYANKPNLRIEAIFINGKYLTQARTEGNLITHDVCSKCIQNNKSQLATQFSRISFIIQVDEPFTTMYGVAIYLNTFHCDSNIQSTYRIVIFFPLTKWVSQLR